MWTRSYATYIQQVIFVQIWIPVLNGCVGNSYHEILLNTEYSLSVYPTVHVITHAFLALEWVCLVWYHRCIYGCKIAYVNSAMFRTNTRYPSVVWQMDSSPRFKISYKNGNLTNPIGLAYDGIITAGIVWVSRLEIDVY